MKEFEVTVSIRNNRIKERREALGLTQAEMEKAIWPQGSSKNRFSCGRCGGLETMRVSPIGRSRHGETFWKSAALKMAEFFGVEPGELWPDAVLMVKNRTVSKKLDAMDMLAIAPPTAMASELGIGLEAEEVSVLIFKAIESFPKNKAIHKQVLMARFGLDGRPPRTLEDIGKEINRSKERVRQIEALALRLIRNPTRSRPLLEAYRQLS